MEIGVPAKKLMGDEELAIKLKKHTIAKFVSQCDKDCAPHDNEEVQQIRKDVEQIAKGLVTFFDKEI